MPQPPSMTRPPLSLVALCAAATVVSRSPEGPARRSRAGSARSAAPSSPACREGRLSTRYLRRVNRVLRARHDAWGRTLLASPRGPTYERVERYLPPLFFARAHNGRPLTESGVHYAHFSQPVNVRGATSFALHVADGSQVITRRAHGRSLAVGVGLRGQERYGSCLRRLRAAGTRRGVSPDPRDDVHGPSRRPLRAGVLRGAHPGDPVARELRPVTADATFARTKSSGFASRRPSTASRATGCGCDAPDEPMPSSARAAATALRPSSTRFGAARSRRRTSPGSTASRAAGRSSSTSCAISRRARASSSSGSASWRTEGSSSSPRSG